MFNSKLTDQFIPSKLHYRILLHKLCRWFFCVQTRSISRCDYDLTEVHYILAHKTRLRTMDKYWEHPEPDVVDILSCFVPSIPQHPPPFLLIFSHSVFAFEPVDNQTTTRFSNHLHRCCCRRSSFSSQRQRRRPATLPFHTIRQLCTFVCECTTICLCGKKFTPTLRLWRLACALRPFERASLPF